MIVKMELERTSCEKDLSSPLDGQIEICIEHQSSQQYLLSMLQDTPIYKYTVPAPMQCYNVCANSSNAYLHNLSLQQSIKMANTLTACDSGQTSLLKSNAKNSIICSLLSTPSQDISSSKKNEQITVTAGEFTEEKVKDMNEPYDSIENPESLEDGKVKDGVRKYDMSRKKHQIRSRCNCKLSIRSDKFHCNDFTDDDRQALFTLFWKVLDWQQRKRYISSLVKCSIPTARRKDCQDPSRKEYAFRYHLRKNNQLLRVCKIMFLTTFDIRDFCVRDWVLPNGSRSKSASNDKAKMPSGLC